MVPAPGARVKAATSTRWRLLPTGASVEEGKPLSERKLAAMFGKTSRRWARNRMTEAMSRVVG